MKFGRIFFIRYCGIFLVPFHNNGTRCTCNSGNPLGTVLYVPKRIILSWISTIREYVTIKKNWYLCVGTDRLIITVTRLFQYIHIYIYTCVNVNTHTHIYIKRDLLHSSLFSRRHTISSDTLCNTLHMVRDIRVYIYIYYRKPAHSPSVTITFLSRRRLFPAARARPIS